MKRNPFSRVADSTRSCRRLGAVMSPTRECLVGDTGKPGYRIEIEEENRIQKSLYAMTAG